MASTSREVGNAHDAGDCLTYCEHPDHAFDGPVNLDWLMFGPTETEDADWRYEPVVL